MLMLLLNVLQLIGAAWKHHEASMICLFLLHRLGWWNHVCSSLSIIPHVWGSVVDSSCCTVGFFLACDVYSSFIYNGLHYVCMYIYIYIQSMLLKSSMYQGYRDTQTTFNISTENRMSQNRTKTGMNVYDIHLYLKLYLINSLDTFP